jgi:hypothetical protein
MVVTRAARASCATGVMGVTGVTGVAHLAETLEASGVHPPDVVDVVVTVRLEQFRVLRGR